jgi:c-di-GMP-related signal transduction protein
MVTTVTGGVEGSSRDIEARAAVTAPHGLRYVARQPILDAHGNMHGYELLFRASATSSAFTGDGDAATRTVLDNTLMFGLERLTGGLPAFVNCTREALVGGLAMVLPSEHTVLEILETLVPDAELLTACMEFKAKGFRLALDDFTWTPEWAPFMAIADYVKVDFSITSPEERKLLRTKLKGSSALLIAERMETPADFKMARSEGFTFFQGYYFCRPVIMENRTIPSNRLVHIEMLQALHEYPSDLRKICELVKRDPSLTYRLLRIVNSPLSGIRHEIRSIQAALVMIGEAMFRRIATLAIASDVKGNHPTELLRMAFQRGRFCELLAPMTKQDPTEQYLLGVLSLLPPMLQVSMETMVMALPLRAEIRQALLGESNPARRMLDWLIANEAAQWERCDEISLAAGLTDTDLPKQYAEAVLWAEANLSLALG